MRLFVRKLIDSLKTRTSDRRRSLQRDDDFEHAIRLGNELEDGGEVEAALTHYRRAANLAPSRPRPLMNMGNALRRLARFDEAIDAQRRAVECAPDYAPARFNLALLLADQGDRAAAENELLKALHCQPTMIEARIVLADIYEAGQRFDEAEAQFIEARKLESSHPGLLLNYGLFCFRQGRFDEAYEWLQRARSADPDKLAIHSLLLMCSNCRDEDAEAIAREHFRVGAALVAAEETKCSTWANIVDEDRPLRIGYVSGDFMPHPVPLFLRPVLEQRNKLEFETFCYSNYGRKNEIAERLKQTADRWREIAELDDRQVVELIRDDRIDVLVDLSGHTDRNRLQVFAGHPAPVQVTWLGYLNTTGLPAMDYRICDAHTDPPGTTEHLHTERLVRMPHSQWCYAPWYEHEVVPNAHPDLSDEIVFGSFNQVIKITPVTLSLWSGVLAGVPKATLVVFDVGQAATREALLRNMEDHGIDTSRVTLRGRVSIKDYFAAIGDVDIGLDTAPYNGATTTLDTLWMGVPVVALRGQRATARSTYSILKTLGAEDLIALNDEDYVDINVRLARDRPRRMEMRQTLRARLTASPLMDTQRFTNALEKRYREMWRAWCRNGATAIAPKSAAFPSPRDCASP